MKKGIRIKIKYCFVSCLMIVNNLMCSIGGSEPIFTQDKSVKKAAVKMEITVNYNPNPVYLMLDQNLIMKTAADGFTPKSGKGDGQYRALGTTYLSWQAKSAYEIIMYTDNINDLGLTSMLPHESQSVSYKTARVEYYNGIYPPKPWKQSNPPFFIPFKVWVPMTAGPGETTAPIDANGVIMETDWNNSFYGVPEKMAIDPAIGTYGSAKKVIASIVTNKAPFRIEMTFGLDLFNSKYASNAVLYPERIYNGKVYVELIGN
ncbi:MAG: hypothetical protein AB1454_13740 [Candidatus Auribacterota bacterium]